MTLLILKIDFFQTDKIQAVEAYEEGFFCKRKGSENKILIWKWQANNKFWILIQQKQIFVLLGVSCLSCAGNFTW